MILEQDIFTKNDISERIRTLQKELQKEEIDFSLIMYKSDLYYYSGTGQSCILTIPMEGEPILFARRLKERIEEETKLDEIVPIRSSKEIYKELKERGLKVEEGRMGLEADVIPAEMYKKTEEIFPNKEAVSIGNTLRMIRAVKDEKEIELLKKSAKILDEVQELVPDIVKEGMTEVELSGKLYAEMRIRGGQAAVRSRDFYTEGGGNGFVLSGNNTALATYTLTATGGPGLHQSNPFGPNMKKIKEGELILVDLSIAYNGYITDETRCYTIGKANQKIKERYQLQLDVENEMAKLMREGKNAMEVYAETYEYAKERGIKENLMGGGEIPFLAHGVGLELNDFPVITKRFDYMLQKGNVLAAEPKLNYYGEMTIGSENTYVVKKNNAETITKAPHPILEG